MANLLTASIVGKTQIPQLIELDKVDIDNWTFKLFSKLSVAVCLISMLACVATTYIGTPITCAQPYDKDKHTETYCWLHGVYHLAKEHEEHFYGYECARDPRYTFGTLDADDTDTEYYQWVVFMLLIHGLLFMVPNKIWQTYEGGLLEQFGNKKEKVGLVLCNHDKFVEEAKQHAKIFKTMASRKKNREYFAMFVFCEILNMMVLALNYYLINIFLGGRFATYGSDVVKYAMSDPNAQYVPLYNPMCDAFPTIINCQPKQVGASGIAETRSILCILSQNIINEKIYLFLWFWFCFLFIVAILTVFYRVFSIIIPGVRKWRLFRYLRTTNRQKAQVINVISPHWDNLPSVGNWFLLCQIGRNSNPYFFRLFLDEITKEEEPEEVKVENPEKEGKDESLELKEVKVGVKESDDTKSLPNEKELISMTAKLIQENQKKEDPEKIRNICENGGSYFS